MVVDMAVVIYVCRTRPSLMLPSLQRVYSDLGVALDRELSVSQRINAPLQIQPDRFLMQRAL